MSPARKGGDRPPRQDRRGSRQGQGGRPPRSGQRSRQHGDRGGRSSYGQQRQGRPHGQRGQRSQGHYSSTRRISRRPFDPKKVRPSSPAVPFDADPTEMIVLEPPRPGPYGTPPDKRELEEMLTNGVIIIDKPAGPTSHQVAAWVREAFGLNKVGHGGTLDPMVTGVLPVALGRATRCVRALLHAPKEYVALAQLNRPVSQEQVKTALDRFIGPIWQLPPREAAVKRELRLRTIYDISLIEAQEQRALFRVRCEAGTYIRNLCRDLGEVLAVGGYMAQLRRTATGAFTETSAVSLTTARDAYLDWKETDDGSQLSEILLPPEQLFQLMCRIVVRDTAVEALCHGAPLAIPGITEVSACLERGAPVSFYSQAGELIGLGVAALSASELKEAHAQATPGLAATLQQVYMEPGKYPRVWKKHDGSQ